MKISSHLNLPETKGVHPLVKKQREIMDNMKSNYLKDVGIQEELKNVKIENHLKFFLVMVDMSFGSVQDVLGLS